GDRAGHAGKRHLAEPLHRWPRSYPREECAALSCGGRLLRRDVDGAKRRPVLKKDNDGQADPQESSARWAFLAFFLPYWSGMSTTSAAMLVVKAGSQRGRTMAEKKPGKGDAKTAKAVEGLLKPGTKPGRYSAGDNLYLKVGNADGQRSWTYVY